MNCVAVFMCVVVATCSARYCSNPPPGVNKQRKGVDVTKLDLLPLDFNTADGFLRPVIDYTCNEGKTWTNNKNKQVFDMPDQVWDISRIPGGWLNANTKIFKNYKEIKRTMSSSAGFGLNIFKGAFSASGSYKRSQHTITNSSKYIEEVSSYSSAVRVDFHMPWSLNISRNAKSFIDRILHSDFNANTAASYFRFIRYFGTHVFQSANYGGIIKLHMETSSDYYKGKSNSDVKAQAEASFLKILSINGGYQGTNTNVDATFKQKTSKTIRYYGGDTNLLSGNGIPTWQPTVSANPWLFSGELIAISEFIMDDTKRASMKKAVAAHINKAYLRELERILLGARQRFTAGSTDISALLARVRTALSQVIPQQSVVDTLGREVDEDFIVPGWFTGQTQLCYRWYADGDGGQCGGGVGRNLCAKPGDMTQYYRDDTDRRSGGCRMSWGIIPLTHIQPSWFNSVQLCYRWHPDGDGGQCGGGAPREMCASVNSYTQYYRDDSDRRSGGCQMSWRLKIPANVPLWMKNTKLCYYWYPDGNGGQCGGGGGISRQLCATANSWTRYYRDDTDSRSGGCMMSWGIKLA